MLFTDPSGQLVLMRVPPPPRYRRYRREASAWSDEDDEWARFSSLQSPFFYLQKETFKPSVYKYIIYKMFYFLIQLDRFINFYF